MKQDLFRLESNFLLTTFHVTASYTTKKGNRKQRIFEIDAVSKDECAVVFHRAINCHNEKHSNAPFFNPEIMCIKKSNIRVVSSNVDRSLSIVSL